MSKVIISIDAMGGDHGIKSTVPASIRMVKRFPELHLILVGNEKTLRLALKRYKAHKIKRLRIQHASEIVEMDELPSLALRNKKDSSMRVAINLVKEGQAQACVSAGNTGALMATSRFVLKMLPGVDRPAILAAIPAFDKETGQQKAVHMLDLGANVECTPEHLFQFAVMGFIHKSNIDPTTPRPKVALLNIGEEEIKGIESIKQAAKLLQECELINYIGFVEGNDIFSAKADVVVCDGFTGNIALKTMEGTVQFMARYLKSIFSRGLLSKLWAILAIPALMRVKHKLDVRRYNGASFIGLKGIVVKSHGGADAIAFETAIEEAMQEVEKDIPSQIHHQLAGMLGQEDDASED